MTTNENPVCIIEDNLINRKIFTQMLKYGGFSSVDFQQGADAIEWMKEHTPSCVVLDILMPKLSGEEILKLIRALPEGDKIPVVAVTALVQETEVNKFLQQGFDGFIPKPANLTTFANEVREVIDKKKL
ncbi:MAG: response regulator [Candidatus Kapabacteria bacterium]|jgi:two-component system cell cycle response regulator DivK|nr:response regulator [Candidatus Kapabacteria bacterium]